MEKTAFSVWFLKSLSLTSLNFVPTAQDIGTTQTPILLKLEYLAIGVKIKPMIDYADSTVDVIYHRFNF